MATPLHAIAELDDLVLDLPRFERALQQFAAELRLDLAAFTADHISLRCHQNATAERWRQGLMQCGRLLSESMINGRPICLFDLSQPLAVADRLRRAAVSRGETLSARRLGTR